MLYAIDKKLSSLQHLLRTTFANSQIYNSKYHKRWYYFAAQSHFGDVLQCKLLSFLTIIRYITFIGLHWRLRIVYRWASLLFRPFWREVPLKIGDKFAFWGKTQSKYKLYFWHIPQKAHPCAKRRHLTYWSWKSVCDVCVGCVHYWQAETIRIIYHSLHGSAELL